MGSLVALSFTVDEKEEWVLSSNRKDNAAFGVSIKIMGFRSKAWRKSDLCHIVKMVFFTFGFASIFE